MRHFTVVHLVPLVLVLFVSRGVRTDSNFIQGKAAYFDAGQLHVIGSSVSGQSKEDVLYSMLLAQLAANAKASRTAISDWYEVYERTLPGIAWVLNSVSPFGTFVPKTDRISLRNIITTSLIGLTTPELQDALNRTFNRIAELSASDPLIAEFNKDTGDGKAYNIQVQSVDAIGNLVTLQQVYVSITTTESVGSDVFLLHEFDKNAIRIKVGYESNTLNSALYATIRQSVIDKLGQERIDRYISKVIDFGSMFG